MLGATCVQKQLEINLTFRYYYAVEPAVAQAQALRAWPGEARAGDSEPFVVSCRPPGAGADARAPAAVSLTLAPCDRPTNVLNVQVSTE